MRDVQAQPRSSAKHEGVSLVELLVVTAFLSIFLGSLGGTIIYIQRTYSSQRQLIEAQDSARLAVDTITRFVRSAGNDPQTIGFVAVDPDPDSDTVLNSIHLKSDWNPPDGDLNDPREDVIFTTNNGVLFKEEPSDGSPVELADYIQSLTFSYRDADNNAVSDPIATPGSIVHVNIEVRTQVDGMPTMLFESSSTLRKRE